MGMLSWLFGTQSDRTNDAPPWENRLSIYEHVLSHVDPSHVGLTKGGETLPDENRRYGEGDIRWADGALDGVAMHHIGGGPDEKHARKIYSALCKAVKKPTDSNRIAFYNLLLDDNTPVAGFIDPVLGRIPARNDLSPAELKPFAEWLAKDAPDRDAVKMGIALLGLYSGDQSRDIFMTLGRHDEFTVYCTVALYNTLEKPEDSLWELAKNVDGWGRIQVVERLANTEKPEIMDWLLREGYKNSVMYEYLAYTCATAGGLLSALSQENIDEELLSGAGDIIGALIAGGPAESIDQYDDGVQVVEAYLGHLTPRASTLEQFLSVHTILQFLKDEDADWETRAPLGWNLERRSVLTELCIVIIDKPEWRELVLANLNTEDESYFFTVDRSAKALDIDIWDTHFSRLQQAPLDQGRWFNVMQGCVVADLSGFEPSATDIGESPANGSCRMPGKIFTMKPGCEDRVQMVLDCAISELPFSDIASGPANELGIGPGFEAHRCLDFVLQYLEAFPGHGWELVKTGLRSPVIRNRNMAIRSLAAWNEDQRTEDIEKVLRQALAEEPNKDVRDSIERLLAD